MPVVAAAALLSGRMGATGPQRVEVEVEAKALVMVMVAMMVMVAVEAGCLGETRLSQALVAVEVEVRLKRALGESKRATSTKGVMVTVLSAAVAAVDIMAVVPQLHTTNPVVVALGT
jgi:hypothetical protein